MKYRLFTRIGSVLLGSALVFGFVLSLPGCSPAPEAAPAAAPLKVSVSYPVEREVTDYVDFTARMAAVDSVEVRAHVWGYLDEVHFKEGAVVNKGDLLFEIDPRPYQGQLNFALAKVKLDQAQLKSDEAEYQRLLQAVRQGVGAQTDLDKALAAREVDKANIDADTALVNQQKLNLTYTKITAPVGGRISRFNVTKGNLVQSGDQSGGTLLTTIVSVDPIYAYFDADERIMLRYAQLVRDGKAKSLRDGDVPVSLGLVSEPGMPHPGTINFVDNQVNPKTGTWRIRAVFPNKDETLTPGLFARIRMPMGQPRKALLISDRALDNDQGQKILYVVNEENKIVPRPVRVGAIHDGMRVIEDGLKQGERIVVEGLQLVRADLVVEPKLVPMPVSITAQEIKPAIKTQPGTEKVGQAP